MIIDEKTYRKTNDKVLLGVIAEWICRNVADSIRDGYENREYIDNAISRERREFIDWIESEVYKRYQENGIMEKRVKELLREGDNMAKYEVIIDLKGVCITVDAKSEEEAKDKAREEFRRLTPDEIIEKANGLAWIVEVREMKEE